MLPALKLKKKHIKKNGGGRRFRVYQRGGSAMSSINRLLVRNAMKQHSNQMGSNAFKSVGKRTFKALTGKTARSIVKNKVLPCVTNESNKRLQAVVVRI